MNEVETLAELLRKRNAIDAEIARLIGRPAERGHIGEFVAAHVFGVVLHDRATHRGHDGVFASGPLAGRTANVKFYGKQEGVLDVHTTHPPDFYMVLTGPNGNYGRSTGQTRPLVVAQVFLFEHSALVAAGVKPGIAAGVRKDLWAAARVWPTSGTAPLALTPEQVRLLRLLAGEP